MTESVKTAASPLAWILGAQEFLWLLMVVGVPLVFLSRGDVLDSPVIVFVEIPKVALLRAAAAAVAALWMAEWVIRGRLDQGRGVEAGVARIGRLGLKTLWKLTPRGWLIAAVAGYFGVTLVTTLLSASMEVSFWGEVPGQDGYPAYTMAAYAVLFAAIATHLKNRRQVGRLMGAFVVSGVLVAGYAICQHYGQDFLALASPVQPERATSTMGNAIFVGSVLLMTVSVTMTAATLVDPGPLRQMRFWLVSGIWAALLTVQLLGIVFTFSRGPWIGLMVAMASFLALTGMFVGWRALLRGGLALSLAAVFSWLVLLIPAPATGGAGEPGASATTSEAAERLTSIGGQVAGGSFGDRRDIWFTSWRLMNQRPWVGFDPLGLSFLRPLVGYGPDLFRTAYLLESHPRGKRLLPGEAHQAHNYFLHAGVEMGYLGLAVSLGLFGVPVLAGGYVLLRRRNLANLGNTDNAGVTVLLAGLMALLAGRFLEQMVGIARVSDLTLFWAALGLLAALPAVYGLDHGPGWEPEGGRHPVDTSLSESTGSPLGVLARSGPFRTLIAAFCILGLAMLTWQNSVNQPRAALEMGRVNELMGQGDFQGALIAVDRAIALAPDVFVYHNHRASILASFQSRKEGPREIGCSRLSQNPQMDILPYEGCLIREIYDSNRLGTFHRPLYYRARVALGATTMALASLTGEPALADDAIRLHREALELMPHSWPLWNRLAFAYVRLGLPAGALPAVERSLSITGGGTTGAAEPEFAASARCIAGLAYRDLGELGRAAASLEKCLQLRDSGSSAKEAHRVLASVYAGLGRQELAERHLELAR